MTRSHAQSRAAFQGELDATPVGGTLELPPCEYPGPVVIRHPLVLDGHGATLWALTGPVLVIESHGVTLRDLRLEVTGDAAGSEAEIGCALLVRGGGGPRLENVEVRGCVLGLSGDRGGWRYPNALHLGPLAHGSEHRRRFRLAVPVPCRLTSNVSGLEVEPQNLTPGTNEVALTVERLPQDTLLNGSLSLTSAVVTRRIHVSAHVVAGATAGSDGAVLWEPSDASPAPPPATDVIAAPPTPVSRPAPPPAPPPSATPPAPVTSTPTSPRIRRKQGALLSTLFSPPAGETKPAAEEATPAPQPPPTPAPPPPPAPPTPPAKPGKKIVRGGNLSPLFGGPPPKPPGDEKTS